METRTKNVFMTTYSNGHVRHFHASTGQLLNDISEIANQVLIGVYRQCGTYFATGGSDCMVRVYDDHSKAALCLLGTDSHATVAGHTNRIFAVEFHPTENDIVFSAGWDMTVIVWSIEQQSALRSFFGPKVCGSALSCPVDDPNLLLIGAWEANQPLQLWNHKTGSIICKNLWEVAKREKPCYIYLASFFKGDTSMIVAGGSEANELRLLRRQGENPTGGQYIEVGSIRLSHGITSCAYDATTDSLVVATGEGLYQYKITDVDEAPTSVDDHSEITTAMVMPVGVEAA